MPLNSDVFHFLSNRQARHYQSIIRGFRMFQRFPEVSEVSEACFRIQDLIHVLPAIWEGQPRPPLFRLPLLPSSQASQQAAAATSHCLPGRGKGPHVCLPRDRFRPASKAAARRCHRLPSHSSALPASIATRHVAACLPFSSLPSARSPFMLPRLTAAPVRTCHTIKVAQSQAFLEASQPLTAQPAACLSSHAAAAFSAASVSQGKLFCHKASHTSRLGRQASQSKFPNSCRPI